ncbi:MAG: LamG-like jellyroll fold domain-containing protein [Mangrovibacterium sp.]
MKINYSILISLLIVVSACDNGIDPISYVAPGNDETAPAVVISYPAEGTKIKVKESVTSIKIQFEVTDDIEIKDIVLSLDGTKIAGFDTFKDYRRLLGEYLYNALADGSHILTLTATDLTGKNTSKSVNFEKEPPYVPIFEGEVFYIPFDGDYTELISQDMATKVGSPGFNDGGVYGKAYAGATDGYLTFPIADIKANEFSAAFWMKLNASPTRAGLISISPTGEDRTKGLRFFREGDAATQRFKLNVGRNGGETWNDGGTVNAASGDWVHLAFTISAGSCVVYINGAAVNTAVMEGAIDWTGCSAVSIGSGAPNFSYWDHKSDLSLFDELRFFNKALSAEEVKDVMAAEGQAEYEPKYENELLYLPFNGNNKDQISKIEATMVGTTGFAGEAKAGTNAYAGAADSYLTFPSSILSGNEFSAVFWMKINPIPDRAGLISVSPGGENRTKGIRFFREGNATSQTFKLNVGTGSGEVWNDGGSVTLPVDGWTHIAFTVSPTSNVIYINGEEIRTAVMTAGVDWTGCNTISIASGDPGFGYWNHHSELSYIDEMRFFSKALTKAEVQAIIADEN